MATEWYLMGSMPVYNSGYEKEEFDAYAKDSFAELLETSPIKIDVKIVKNDLSVISEIKAIIIGNISDSQTKSTERQILTTIGTLQCGDYILFENKVWLAISLVGNNGIYEKTILQRCNYTLKLQHPTTGAILSYPCIDSAATSSSGLDTNDVITTLNARHTIKLPFDDITKQLREGKKRLLIDVDGVYPPQAYKITDRNVTTNNYGDNGGLVVLIIEKTEFNEKTDNAELMIADYFTVTPTPEPSTSTTYATITCSDPSNQVMIGMSSGITLVPTFYNADKTVNNTVVAVWDITKPVGFENLIAVSQVWNNVKIVAKDDIRLLDKNIVCKVGDGNGGFNGEITISIGSGW